MNASSPAPPLVNSADGFGNGQGNTLVLAARAFVAQYHLLGTGPRAQLRRSELPATQAGFWICLAAARRAGEAIDRPRTRRLLEEMLQQQIFDLVGSTDNGENIGAYLRRHSREIKPRRVEALLACDTREAALEEIARILTIGRGLIDHGVLVSDLVFFGDHVRRHWAEGYFA